MTVINLTVSSGIPLKVCCDTLEKNRCLFLTIHALNFVSLYTCAKFYDIQANKYDGLLLYMCYHDTIQHTYGALLTLETFVFFVL